MAVRPVFWIRIVLVAEYAPSSAGSPEGQAGESRAGRRERDGADRGGRLDEPGSARARVVAGDRLADAVFMIAAFTCSGVQRGWAWRTRAAMPATWGVDIDVPDSRTPSVPVPTAAEKTDRPGAATSGLRLPSAAGPPDEKSAIGLVGRVGQSRAAADRDRRAGRGLERGGRRRLRRRGTGWSRP